MCNLVTPELGSFLILHLYSTQLFSANAKQETAAAKNAALKKAGAHVPDSFDDFGNLIEEVYTGLVNRGVIEVLPERPPPPVPIDYAWARVRLYCF